MSNSKCILFVLMLLMIGWHQKGISQTPGAVCYNACGMTTQFTVTCDTLQTDKYVGCVLVTNTSTTMPLTFGQFGSGIAAFDPTNNQYLGGIVQISSPQPLSSLTIPANGGTATICFIVSSPSRNIRLQVLADDGSQSAGQPTLGGCRPSSYCDVSLPPCRCNACKAGDIVISNSGTRQGNSEQMLINGNLTVFNHKVREVVAEIVDIQYKTSDTLCRLCNFKNKNEGVFIDKNVLTDLGWTRSAEAIPSNTPFLSTGVREIRWQQPAGGGADMSMGTKFLHTIGIPNLNPLKCCADEVCVTIRYSIIDVECHLCEITQVYCLNRNGYVATTPKTSPQMISAPVKNLPERK